MNLTDVLVGSTMVAKFAWTPSTQGNYTVNITASSSSESTKKSEMFKIKNVSDIGIEDWEATAPKMEPLNYYPLYTDIDLSVTVKNHGNFNISVFDLAVKITFGSETEYEGWTTSRVNVSKCALTAPLYGNVTTSGSIGT